MMLVFIPAVGEYVIPELLGGPQAQLIGRVLWAEFFANRDWPTASALAGIAAACTCRVSGGRAVLCAAAAGPYARRSAGLTGGAALAAADDLRGPRSAIRPRM
jgi:ABC-type spermidine/putrescine transport system permease subunit I